LEIVNLLQSQGKMDYSATGARQSGGAGYTEDGVYSNFAATHAAKDALLRVAKHKLQRAARRKLLD
jgi:hypothetical protein